MGRKQTKIVIYLDFQTDKTDFEPCHYRLYDPDMNQHHNGRLPILIFQNVLSIKARTKTMLPTLFSIKGIVMNLYLLQQLGNDT